MAVRLETARDKMAAMESPRSHEGESHHGEALAEVTDGIVRLFRESYGRGPTRAKSYLLDDRYVVTVLRDTMTTVERTLVDLGHMHLVRSVRVTFQEAMAASFKEVVEQAIGRRVASYHSQLMTDPDMGFEFFLLED
jgi:uncharacterized protein YbcI